MKEGNWSLDDLENHMRTNAESNYGCMVVEAALFKKLYGFFPSFGMSGMQAEFAEHVFQSLPGDMPPEVSQAEADARSI